MEMHFERAYGISIAQGSNKVYHVSNPIYNLFIHKLVDYRTVYSARVVFITIFWSKRRKEG